MFLKAWWDRNLGGNISLSYCKQCVLAAILPLFILAATGSANASPDRAKNSSYNEASKKTDSASCKYSDTTEITVILETYDNESKSAPDDGSYLESGAFSDAMEHIRSKIREIALAYLGTPYRWGGTTPNAFDCSGFVKYIYNKVGIRLPRTAREQIKVGNPVKNGYWETGDLVFFDIDKGYVSHVGMYLGDYKFIHAARPGVGVTVGTLKQKYYRDRYVGARRFNLV